LPIEFEDMLRYTRALEFTDRPDYTYCRKMLDAVLFRAHYEDYAFDWKILHQKEKVIQQLYVEKQFLKTELAERRRRWDPSLFAKLSSAAHEEVKLPMLSDQYKSK
jgi:hypothetical protein